MRGINIGLAIGIMTLIGLFVFAACDKTEPKVSEEEATARLKVAEIHRESEMRESHFETETTTVIEPTTVDDTWVFEESWTEEVYIAPETEFFEETFEVVEIEPTTAYIVQETGIEETESPTEISTGETEEDPWGFTDDELYEIARITYLENGCEGYYYPTYLTACVILNRYLDWGYGSISEVIHAPGQYSTADKYTNWSGGELVISDMTWQAVYDAMANLDRNPHYQMNGGSGNLYYRHDETGECFYY